MIVHVNKAPGAAAFIEATSFVTVKHLATVALICWNCTSYIFEKKINKLKSTFFLPYFWCYDGSCRFVPEYFGLRLI